jgi:hypothetical protein
MSERPFDERYAVARQCSGRFEAVLGRHPFMRFAFAANAVLRRVSLRREHAGDAVDLPDPWTRAKAALQPHGLPDVEKMRRGSVLDRACIALHEGCHDCLRSSTSAASSEAASIGTICCVDPFAEIAGR